MPHRNSWHVSGSSPPRRHCPRPRRQGQEGDNFYVVEAGAFRATKDGAEVASYAGAGAFGELALMYGCPRAATVTGACGGRPLRMRSAPPAAPLHAAKGRVERRHVRFLHVTLARRAMLLPPAPPPRSPERRHAVGAGSGHLPCAGGGFHGAACAAPPREPARHPHPAAPVPGTGGPWGCCLLRRPAAQALQCAALLRRDCARGAARMAQPVPMQQRSPAVKSARARTKVHACAYPLLLPAGAAGVHGRLPRAGELRGKCCLVGPGSKPKQQPAAEPQPSMRSASR